MNAAPVQLYGGLASGGPYFDPSRISSVVAVGYADQDILQYLC